MDEIEKLNLLDHVDDINKLLARYGVNGSSTLILNYILKYPVYQDIFLSRNFDFIVAIVAYYLKLCYNM